jgi:hypothetical protein
MIFGIAAAAILATTAGVNAQECRGGYRTLPNQVIVSCGDEYYYTPDDYYAPDDAPLYTGSVYVPAPRVYVERRYRPVYDEYWYDDDYYDRRYRRHYYRYSRYDDDCWRFRAFTSLIPFVTPPAC